MEDEHKYLEHAEHRYLKLAYDIAVKRADYFQARCDNLQEIIDKLNIDLIDSSNLLREQSQIIDKMKEEG